MSRPTCHLLTVFFTLLLPVMYGRFYMIKCKRREKCEIGLWMDQLSCWVQAKNERWLHYSHIQGWTLKTVEGRKKSSQWIGLWAVHQVICFVWKGNWLSKRIFMILVSGQSPCLLAVAWKTKNWKISDKQVCNVDGYAEVGTKCGDFCVT